MEGNGGTEISAECHQGSGGLNAMRESMGQRLVRSRSVTHDQHSKR